MESLLSIRKSLEVPLYFSACPIIFSCCPIETEGGKKSLQAHRLWMPTQCICNKRGSPFQDAGLPHLGGPSVVRLSWHWMAVASSNLSLPQYEPVACGDVRYWLLQSDGGGVNQICCSVSWAPPSLPHPDGWTSLHCKLKVKLSFLILLFARCFLTLTRKYPRLSIYR